MKKNTFFFAAVILSLVVVAGTGFAVYASNLPQEDTVGNDVIEKDDATESMVKDESDNSDSVEITDKNSMESAGIYKKYSKSSLTEDKNVIFFAASWCPTCQGLDNSINANLKSIPSDLTILKADFDTENELRKQYGVTIQHTLVQVDKDGNMIKKWNGSEDISAILSQLQ